MAAGGIVVVLLAASALAVAFTFAAQQAAPMPASTWHETDAMPFFPVLSAYGIAVAAFSAATQ